MLKDDVVADVITLTTRVCAKPTVFGTSVDDDLILFDPESGTYYGAGAVGQKIWDLITDEREVKAVCDDLLEEFDIDRQTCEADVLEFLNTLHAKGLIQADPGETSEQ